MRLGCIFIALAKMPSTSVSSSTDRRTQNERSWRAGRWSECSIETRRSSTGTSSSRAFSSVDLPVDRSPKMSSGAPVGDVAREAGRLGRRHGAALDQAAQGGRHGTGGAELTGVHRRGGRARALAAARDVRHVGGDLRLEQHAQSVQVLARLFAELLRAKLVEHLVEHGGDVALEAGHERSFWPAARRGPRRFRAAR